MVYTVSSNAGIRVVTFEANKGETFAWDQFAGGGCASEFRMLSLAPAAEPHRTRSETPEGFLLSSFATCHAHTTLSISATPQNNGQLSRPAAWSQSEHLFRSFPFFPDKQQKNVCKDCSGTAGY